MADHASPGEATRRSRPWTLLSVACLALAFIVMWPIDRDVSWFGLTVPAAWPMTLVLLLGIAAGRFEAKRNSVRAAPHPD